MQRALTTLFSTAVVIAAMCMQAHAQPKPFPAEFRTQTIAVNDGARLHVRVDGSGPAVVLLHGFGETGDMWEPLARALVASHRVVVPDLRGMGRSSRAAAGYEKKSQAGDIRTVLDRLGIDQADIVGHDIGTMVAYAYAVRYPDKTSRLVVMDAPVPGVASWDQIVRMPALWHFDFGGADVERLVQGRERVYLDRFWNEFAGNPTKIDEPTRAHYAKLYAQPGAMRAAFAQFRAIRKDSEDNAALASARLTMPVLAIGGEKSFGANQAGVMRNVATNVTEQVVPGAGHWLMEEAPEVTTQTVKDFLGAPLPAR